jgi:hypothetical protein
MMTLYPNDVF